MVLRVISSWSTQNFVQISIKKKTQLLVKCKQMFSEKANVKAKLVFKNVKHWWCHLLVISLSDNCKEHIRINE